VRALLGHFPNTSHPAKAGTGPCAYLQGFRDADQQWKEKGKVKSQQIFVIAFNLLHHCQIRPFFPIFALASQGL